MAKFKLPHWECPNCHYIQDFAGALCPSCRQATLEVGTTTKVHVDVATDAQIQADRIETFDSQQGKKVERGLTQAEIVSRKAERNQRLQALLAKGAEPLDAEATAMANG